MTQVVDDYIVGMIQVMTITLRSLLEASRRTREDAIHILLRVTPEITETKHRAEVFTYTTCALSLYVQKRKRMICEKMINGV